MTTLTFVHRLVQALILTGPARANVQLVPSAITDAFIESRCDVAVGLVFGTLGGEVGAEVQNQILKRVMP